MVRCSLTVTFRAYTGQMLRCDHFRCDLCQLDIPWETAGYLVDPYGTCFVCPECGRRNYLEFLGLDPAGAVLVQQVNRPTQQ